MFKDKLYNINKDLQMHKRTKAEIMEQAVALRLDVSLQSYMYDMDNSYAYLASRNSTRLFSRMSRGRKKDDKSNK